MSNKTTDYDAIMWATLRVWANGDADSLEQEVMAWAASEIERMRAATAACTNTTGWQEDRFYWLRVRRRGGPTPQAWYECDWEIGRWDGHYWDLTHDDAIYEGDFDQIIEVHPVPLEPPQ